MKDIRTPLLSLIRERQKTDALLSVKDAAETFKTTMKNIIDIASDEGININVGIRTQSGTGRLAKRDWTLEDLNSEYE